MSEKTLLYLYFNFRASRMQAGLIGNIERTFNNAGLAFESLYNIESLAHISASHIVIFGGDGTIHQVLNNANTNGNSFSFVRSGSGNDLVKNFPKSDLQALANKIKAGRCDQIDAITFNKEKICINAGGFGFDALVAKRATELPRSLKQLRYSLAVLQNIFGFRPKHVKIISANFEYEGPIFMLSAGNGKFAGGGFKLYPNANIRDGLMDILIIKPINFLQKIKYVWLVRNGRHLQLPVVNYFQSKKVEIRFDHKTIFEADGELYEGKNFMLELQSHKIKVIM